MSEAEADSRTVGELLRALVLGYELVTRIARGWTPRDMLMQPHARYASIGAAAAASLIRRTSPEEFLSAFTGACTLALSGPRNHAIMGALVRNVWPAVGAWCGLMCADWARCGIGGVPEGPYDVFSDLLHGTARPEELTAGLGESWAVLDGYAKIHACCQHAHSAVEAAQELRAALLARGSLSSVARVQVETHAGAMMLQNYRPATTLATKFSVPHIVAATLVTGQAGVNEFTHSAMRDPQIARMRDLVEMKLFEPKLNPPNDRPARITAVLTNGDTLVSECLSAQGGPDRPFLESVLWTKIVDLAEPAYPNFKLVFESMIALEGGWLATPWRDVVSALDGSGTLRLAVTA
jgi:2-methylcitrate dehydratase PrpD